MAEFQEVFKHWRRMCRMHNCKNCPGGESDGKDSICVFAQPYDERTEAEVENIIMAWAAENPEPIYPTWKDYFTMLYGQDYGLYGDKKLSLSHLCSEQIPPKVAVKLGLDPT